ncbi:MAG: DUF4258 domain-containing protein [Chloroflexi bacterium]|nr:DUF4258 domain-containing protein [Chloroflexota bacterium]
MSESIDIANLRDAFRRGQIQWQRHALEQMMKRGVSRKAVRNVILKGERIEDYPGDWPLPSVLLFGWTDARPIHVVAAYDNVAQIIYILLLSMNRLWNISHLIFEQGKGNEGEFRIDLSAM